MWKSASRTLLRRLRSSSSSSSSPSSSSSSSSPCAHVSPSLLRRPCSVQSPLGAPPLISDPLRGAPSSRSPSSSWRWLSSDAKKTDEVKVVVDISEDSGKLAEVDDDLGIATGVELQELLAERQGKKLFDLEPPRGPFGTKESPAIIQSLYDERIVGCSGGIGEDEHDVVWFKLKKGERYECTVCTQVFELEVIGPGGPPGGHHHH